ncbi:MAG: helix-turn-helix domain-containing protein [Planctomycetota bacterium]
MIERVAALSQVDEVGPEHLPPAVQGLIGGEPAPAAGDAPLKEALARYERRYLEHLLETVQGNVSEAARRAGVSRPSLHRRMKEYGIDPDTSRVHIRGAGTTARSACRIRPGSPHPWRCGRRVRRSRASGPCPSPRRSPPTSRVPWPCGSAVPRPWSSRR